MRLGQSVKFGTWVLIFLNLSMSFGSIWVFMRMAPAIEVIIDQNGVSLHACEEMLALLATKDHAHEVDIEKHIALFKGAVSRARNNITEKDEPIAIDLIDQNYTLALHGDRSAVERTVEGIRHLSEINRSAMLTADEKARQLGHAGAWGVVFMAIIVFITGMLFRRILQKNLVGPLEEIDRVMRTFRSGDTMRRCTPDSASPKTIKHLYDNLNELLDTRGSHNSQRPRTPHGTQLRTHS